jgi:hydrogenase-4 component B
MNTLAVVGLIAALFHTLNHATFKALLFLAAGSVISATHTRNIEEYGGLIKKMPQTALFFLVGSMAISALPPFNGFFSEWLTFQSLFQGVTASSPIVQIGFLLSIGALAFTGGLAAACFVKAFGVAFLARPRSHEAEKAKEVGLSLQIGMGLLALLTLVLGFMSGAISKVLSGVVKALDVFSEKVASVPSSQFDFTLINNGFSSVSAPVILLALILALTVVSGLVVLVTRGRKVSVGRTWDCGSNLTPRMEITATAFSRSIITIFKGFLRPTLQTEVEYRDSNLRYFPKSGLVSMELKDIYSAYLIKPIQKFFYAIAEKVKKIQSGNINGYILYIFVALIALLLILVI